MLGAMIAAAGMACSRDTSTRAALRKLRSLALLGLSLSVLMGATPCAAEDIPGAKDHPLLGRYKDASIVFYKASDFDELVFVKAPHNYGALLERNATDDRSGPEWLKLQGRATEIRYSIPPGRSYLEVATNYELALKSKGFEIVFSCAGKACFTGSMNDLYLLGQQLDPTNGLSTAYSGHALYFLAKLNRPGGQVYASVLSGDDNAETVVFVRVLEEGSMATDRIVVVKADEMNSSIVASGRVDLYGIEFDFDRATIKPESKATIDEIAKLLAARPNLQLEIVGHTDGKGTDAYNLDLSNRRAANVVAALVGTYGIEQARLSSHGAGMSQPIASNDTDEGRARNRRVELIAK